MARMILALVLCGVALAMPAAAQNEKLATPAIPMTPPAPYDGPTGSVEAVAPKLAAENPPPADSKPPENPAAENPPPPGAATEGKPVENGDSRFTFTRMNDGYVRLDNRTGQVSVCSKRAVGWTCQLAAEDRGALESEIGRLQDENVALKKELLANGMPLPGSMKGNPPPAPHQERSFSLPSDQNIERMKAAVEKAWRRLVDMITTLQKDMLKKS